MPLFHEDPTSRSGPSIIISGSIAAELDWALSAVQHPQFQRDHAVLDRVFEGSPELVERARSFWGPGEQTSYGGSIEIMVLAHHGGLLYSMDADELLGRLEQICAHAPTDLRLGSESVEDRAALTARLARLRSSPAARRRYVQLIRDVWAALRPDWERSGRSAVNAAVASRCELKQRGAPWREVVGNHKFCNEELVSELTASVGPNGAIAVVPAFFAHLGSLVDLPGTVVLGVRADAPAAQARARTELLARRLRTISDPTRLAMLEALQEAPMTVSELAAHFSLAQPTVSNHVKLLRDAGIVANGNDAGRRVLAVQPDALTDLLDHLEDMLQLARSAAGTNGRRSP